MNKVKLNKNVEISRVVHGHWRLLDWAISNKELLSLTKECIEIGVTTFDHADIYGNHECEKRFGDTLLLEKGLRNSIQIVTKCGIKLATDKFPEREIKTYEYSKNHIIQSVENSLQNFSTDYIDVLLLHRPSPLLNPNKVAEAFSQLKKEGKVLSFGVSNFTQQQFEMLNSFLEEPLVTNQIEISALHLEHIKSGNLDYLLQRNVPPMAWSPLAGGKIFNPTSPKAKSVLKVLETIAENHQLSSTDIIAYSWLYKLPSKVIPIVGSSKIERIKHAVEALEIDLTNEEWFKIYIASMGQDIP